MSVEDANAALNKYQKNRKAFTNSLRAKRIQEGDIVNVHPYMDVQKTILQVALAYLEMGQSFKEKDMCCCSALLKRQTGAELKFVLSEVTASI
jgi:hypothetical protein